MPVTRALTILLGFVLSTFTSNPYAVQRLDGQEEALGIIAAFADRICNKYSMRGGEETIKLSGEARAELSNVLKKLADLGIQGAAEYQKSDYQGPLRKDLADLVRESTECRFAVFKELNDRLLPVAGSASHGLPSGFSVDDEGFVVRPDGERICRSRTVPGPPCMALGDTQCSGGVIGVHECKLYDGTWIKP